MGSGVLPSVCQGFQQMPYVAVQVPVDLGEHSAVSMAHEFGDGEVIVPLHQLPGGESVPRIIHRHRLAGDLRETLHPVADGVFCPGPSACVTKQLSFRPVLHQPGDDGVGQAVQIDDTGVSLALGLDGGENDSGALKLDVTGLDVAGFLRAAASCPDELEENAEGVALVEPAEDRLEIVGAHWIVAAASGRLAHLAEWCRVDVTHLLRPTAKALHGSDPAAFVRVAPRAFAI